MKTKTTKTRKTKKISKKSNIIESVVQRNTPKIDPVTGEKRKRGRPKGSKNKTTPTTKKTTKKVKK